MKLYAKPGFESFEQGRVGHWCPVLTGRTDTTLLDCNLLTSNHGTLANFSNLNIAWAGTQYGTVLDFDGVDDRANTGAWRGLSGDYSASFWFRSSFATSGATCMLASSYNGGGGVHVLGLRGTDGALYGFAGGERVFGGGYNNNTWVLATIVRRASDGQGTVYANGISLGSQAGLGNQDPGGGAGWRLGGTPFFGSQFLGQIAEVTFYNRMFTLAEHQTAYQASPGGIWQPYPRRPRSYFAQVLTTYRNRSSRYLCFPG